jgi:hypothetical protein
MPWGREVGTKLVAVVAVTVISLGAPMATPGVDAGPVATVIAGLETADLERPRILFRTSDLPVIHDRVTREPYRGLVRDLTSRMDAAPAPSAAEQANCVLTENREREGAKSKAAKNAAFLYGINRVWDPGTSTVIQPDAATREALGDLARDHLRFMCTRSRMSEQTDRDINTSHELAQMAMAYDTLAGTGYDFGPHEGTIVGNLVALTSDFFHHYVYPGEHPFPASASIFLVNNHRSKGAASIGIAALVLAEHRPGPGDDPRLTDPARWLDFALDRVDLVQRHTYGTQDGAYGEGAHYWRFAGINLIPFLRAWHDINDGRSWTTQDGLTLPSLWGHPQFHAMQQWMIDTSLPDGTHANFDDSNVGQGFWHGAFPPSFPGAREQYWRWQTGVRAHDSDASIDMAADQIVTFDDTAAAGPPTGSPTRFYPEGGNAIFRSDWTDQGHLMIIQGEHEAAREFGRLRDGSGEQYSAAHDQADPGSYQLHAFGERLMLDPGYINYPWTLQWVMNKPSDHNMVLVGPIGNPGESPRDPLTSSVNFGAISDWVDNPWRPTPTDGEAYLVDLLDSSFVDTATVLSSYGEPADARADVRRRFLFVDDSYVVIADDVESSVERTYTWPLHGNGGGADGIRPEYPALPFGVRPLLGAAALPPEPYVASGGSFAETATGARWTRPGAGVTVGMAFEGASPQREVTTGFHEITGKRLAQHSVLRMSVQGRRASAVSILAPNQGGTTPPAIDQLVIAGGTGLSMVHGDDDRRVVVLRFPPDGTTRTVPTAVTGVAPITTDGTLVVVDTHLDGRLRSAYAEQATQLAYNGVTRLRGDLPGLLALRSGAGRAEVIADNGAAEVVVGGLDFVPTRADGACGLDTAGAEPVVQLGHERRFVLRAGGEASRPAADPGPPLVTDPGAVELDGRASCQLDGAALTPRWRVTSAPPPGTWALQGADTWEPVLDAAVPGLYRVQLTVADAVGGTSLERELVVSTGPQTAPGSPGDTGPVSGGPPASGPASGQREVAGTDPRRPRFTG